MESVVERKRSPSALFLLFSEGCVFLLLGAAVLACGFVLNYHKDYNTDQVDVEQDYTQYWVGLVFFFTSFLAISAGSRQKSRWLVVTAMFFFFVCILVSLFALVVEGNDWIKHKNAHRRKGFWESESYACSMTTTTSCACTKTTSGRTDIKMISSTLSCKMLERLTYLYGGIACCTLVGIFLALSGIIIVMIFIPIRPFTIPVPQTKIKNVTVIKQKKPRPVVVYKPKTVVEPEPEVEEIIVRERPAQRTRTIVYATPEQERRIVYRRPERQQSLVYDEPLPEMQQRQSLTLLAPPALPDVQEPNDESPTNVDRRITERMLSHEYDVGHFVAQDPPYPPSREFTANPNFTQRAVLVREERHPVRYVKESVVHGRVPETNERVLVPVRRPVAHVETRPVRYVQNPRKVHTLVAPREQVVVVRRPRANSDVGPRFYREARPEPIIRTVRPEPRMRAVRVEPRRQRKIHLSDRRVPTYVENQPRIVRQRPRANSDQGPRLYRQPLQQKRPSRIYTDREIAMANQAAAQPAEVRTQLLTQENTLQGGPRAQPITGYNQTKDDETYDHHLEATLQTADRMGERPGTPY